MSPQHSIGFCPICGGGLCGIRLCDGAPESADSRSSDRTGDGTHAFVICDECEAIWLTPDLETAHQYPDAGDARCPICRESLWGGASRWAEWSDIVSRGWEFAVDRALDASPDPGQA